MILFRRYKKKIEQRFSHKMDRRGFNFVCDVALANRVRLIAKWLEVPYYVLMEEITELGLSEVAEIVEDSALKERLQRHLVEEHLLVDRLDPEAKTISKQALRIHNAMKYLQLWEDAGMSLLDITRALNSVRVEKGT